MILVLLILHSILLFGFLSQLQSAVSLLIQSILQQSSAHSADVLFTQLDRRLSDMLLMSPLLTVMTLLPSFSSSLHRFILLSGESGFSSWLTALPLSKHAFALHKFRSF